MINENILDKCFRLRSSFSDPRISPLTRKHEYPQTDPINYYPGCKPTRQTKAVSYYSMLMYSSLLHKSEFTLCFKHSNFFTVNDASTVNRQPNDRTRPSQIEPNYNINKFLFTKQFENTSPTTSFLTATTLIYAFGAGITAAAGTRLALQWFSWKLFKFFSFQLPDEYRPALGFLVTTSLCQDWVIYAPAAFLGCGSRF